MKQFQTIEEIDIEVKKQRDILSNLETQKILLARDKMTNSTAGELATFLHETFCRFNHTDGCGWHYEFKNGIPNWNGHAHKKYYDSAVLILNKFKLDDVKEISNLIKRTI